MTDKKILSTYERIILFKRIPYWLYWPIVGLLGFILGEIALTLLNEEHFLITQALFGAGVGLLPIVIISFAHQFEKATADLSGILWASDQEYAEWFIARKTRIFTLNSWVSKLVTAFVVIGALLTISWLGFPFKTLTANILAILGFIPLLIICGQGAYLLIVLLLTLREMVHLPPKVSFYLHPHPAIVRLQNSFSSASLIVTLAYICLVVSIWQGPYGFSLEMQIWLTILAFYPISMFFWSFFHVHILMLRVKNSHLETINREVNQTLEQVLKSRKNDDVERLEKLMGIQNKVQAMKEYPIEVQGALTFMATFTTLLIQIIISIGELLKP